jgi:hypothetical protein
MHLLANRVMLKHLKEHGLLQGDVDDMMKVVHNSQRKENLKIIFVFRMFFLKGKLGGYVSAPWSRPFYGP